MKCPKCNSPKYYQLLDAFVCDVCQPPEITKSVYDAVPPPVAVPNMHMMPAMPVPIVPPPAPATYTTSYEEIVCGNNFIHLMKNPVDEIDPNNNPFDDFKDCVKYYINRSQLAAHRRSNVIDGVQRLMEYIENSCEACEVYQKKLESVLIDDRQHQLLSTDRLHRKAIFMYAELMTLAVRNIKNDGLATNIVFGEDTVWAGARAYGDYFMYGDARDSDWPEAYI
jgi:hypothetical protein